MDLLVLICHFSIDKCLSSAAEDLYYSVYGIGSKIEPVIQREMQALNIFLVIDHSVCEIGHVYI